ncbi:TPA: hypothetical protein ACKP5X_000910 [Stenotrophomonas maltophilia]
MDAEHLEYFKAALEGRATVGWNVWFAANQQALAQQVSRPALLRLKFNHLHEAERLLAEAGIVPRSTAGKRYERWKWYPPISCPTSTVPAWRTCSTAFSRKPGWI